MSSAPPEIPIAKKTYLSASSDDNSSDEEEVVLNAGKTVDIQSNGTANEKKPEIKIGSKVFTLKVQPGTEGASCTYPRRNAICRCRNYKSTDGCLFKGLIMKKNGQTAPAFGCVSCGDKDRIHLLCFVKLMEKKYKSRYLVCPEGSLLYVCSAKCYNSMKVKDDVKEVNIDAPLGLVTTNSKTHVLPWNADNDDVNKTSIVILLTWLTTEENTNMYLGAEDSVEKDGKFGGDDGNTKNALTVKLSNLIFATNGIRRSPKSVRCKIDQLFAKYKSTNDWTKQTGQGVEAETDKETFEEIVRQKFEYYYILDPVLGSRPNFCIPYSTDDLDEGVLNLNTSEFNVASNDEASDDENEDFNHFTLPASVPVQTLTPITAPTPTLTSTQTQVSVPTLTQTSTQVVHPVSLPTNKRHGSIASDVLRSMKKSRPVSTPGKLVTINVGSNTKEGSNVLSARDEYYSNKISFQADQFELVKAKEKREAEMFELEKEKLKAQNLKLKAETAKEEREAEMFELEKEILKAENITKVAATNKAVFEMRQQHMKEFPDTKKEELDEMYQFMKYNN